MSLEPPLQQLILSIRGARLHKRLLKQPIQIGQQKATPQGLDHSNQGLPAIGIFWVLKHSKPQSMEIS
ncbi:hypothetical protein [Synechococcus sp. LA31]|uniref:hypothetical protein n=1 Tax=Synechococcus sp. LA31 TaxID=2741953 RepID=UPI001BDC5E9C|nr:hypothetical protein [Synechococcus sp. LA31]QVV67446.1 hypothetical protein KJJ24_13695 [Synechococcus sp. LA31]